MLIFTEGGKPENPEKNPRDNGENTHQANNKQTAQNLCAS